MSDVSQGPGWWLASDGKWYPPQSAPAPLPPPPPPPVELGNGSKKTWKGVVAALAACAALAVLFIGVANYGKTGSTAVATTAPSASQGNTAGNDYTSAYNTMNDAVGKLNAAENGTDPSAASAAWNAEVAVRKAFDSDVELINFPSEDVADAKQVISTDAALESAESTLAANTGDVSNYNSVFGTVTTADSAFAGANTALCNDLGLSTN